MAHRIVLAQLATGLRGLGLLRSWPFLDEASARARLQDLVDGTGSDDERSLDVLDVHGGYAAWSRTYDSEDNPLLLAEQPAMEQVLRALAPGDALDAACGTGRIARLLTSLGHRVTGVDASEAMLEQARGSVPGVDFRRASLDKLPFDDSAFDLVTCALSLTHVTTLTPYIAEFARVLRPGGRLVTSDVHPLAVTVGAHAFFAHEDGTRGVVRNEVHWHSEYVDAFAAAGLHVTRCVEPVFSEEVLDAFLSKGSTPANENLLLLPYVLIWECAR